ncbi:uncharacterized protein [Miscanthus floridulus]|uniref:uncharacterized protein isoform X3 n=1 Tax=Miscanthus floridulus TaxID=154761 RepID=UPI0034583143
MDIPLYILKEITKDFSHEHKIGGGGYGNVYKGVYNGEDIAVKLLHQMQGFEEDPFGSEFVNLMSIKHPHVVRLVGYCYEIQHKHVNYKGMLRFSQYIYRALCFEYLQGGSLDRYLDACDKGSRDYKWRTHFNIIKGVSEDFGLSRLFNGEKTHITETTKGTAKYMPPEHEYKQMISPKNDVFSLGVIIIEVVDGPTGYCNFREMDDVIKFIHLVNMKWSKRINATKSPCPSAELDQVETCIKIAIKCVDHERNNRPTVAEIVHILQETENKFLEVRRSHKQFPMDQDLPIFQELIAGENSTSSLQQAGSEDLFSVINLRTQMVILPLRVCFKGENGYYLSARSIEGNNYLEFSSDGFGDSTVRHSIHHNGDGTIRIKSDHFGKFWRRGPKWIWADSDDTTSNNPDTLFRAVKVGNIYALQNLGNNKYCKRLTDEGKVSCLCAAVPTMNEWTHLKVEEPVLSRRIYNIEYQVQNAKIYGDKVLSMNSTEVVNHGSKANTANVTLHYSVSKTKTWESSISVKLVVTTTIEAGVPEIVNASVLIQSEYSSSYTWGDSMTNTVEHSMIYEVIVPPKTKVTLRPLVTEATCEVPFSYHQEDVLTDGQKVVYKLDDGIYRGVNSYNFRYDITEESFEDISPHGLTEECFGNTSRQGPSRRHVLKHFILFILQVCWCLPGKPQD